MDCGPDVTDWESDFYGDEEEVAVLESKVESFDVSVYRTRSQRAMPAALAARRRPGDQPAAAAGPALHNPYAGVPSAWQLTESVPAFLARLPPQTTDADRDAGLAWIWICNPYIPRRPRAEATSRGIRGCEDEAPEESGARVDVFCRGAKERLDMFADLTQHAKQSGRSRIAIARETNRERGEAVSDIYGLAQHLGVRPGKWMLFPEPGDVNAVWGAIARATANNELGIAAKVAPRDPDSDRSARLVCVYTYNFADRDDVARVLDRLRQLELVRAHATRQIYYKADALTYLGINRDNPWGIKASLYSSNEIFDYLRAKQA